MWTELNLSQIGHNGLLWNLDSKCFHHCLAEEQEDQRFKGTEVVWRKMLPKRWSDVRDVEVLATLRKLANWPRLEKMVRELHLGTRLTKGMFLCTKSRLL